jgi:transposase
LTALALVAPRLLGWSSWTSLRSWRLAVHARGRRQGLVGLGRRCARGVWLFTPAVAGKGRSGWAGGSIVVDDGAVRDTELYRHLLGISSPWTVSRVELSVEEGKVDVWVDHPRGTRWPCPECDRELSTYDHADERAWRHLDSCQFLTYLHARPPRVDCPDHGVRQIRLPWADPMARFTTLFERLAVDVLTECDVLGASRLLRLSWDEAWHLMERAVQRGLSVKPERTIARIGVDEKAAGKGHDYITVVCDLDRGTVEHIADERKQASLHAYFERLSPQQREAIEAVAMDMWDAYVNSVRAHLDDADHKIVYDRFHIMGHMGKAVDTVRKREHRTLRDQGDGTLTGSKYLWLYSHENLPERHRERFAALRDADLKTGRAWAIKENLRLLWTYRRRGWGERHWKRWYFWATHCRLQPVIDVAHMLKRRLDGILSYFTHPITNAGSEGLNSRIKAVSTAARGYRNREHFKTAIYFHCGGLELYPATHTNPG